MTEQPKSTAPSILIVDNDPNELKSLLIGLRLEGFAASGAPSSAAAFELLAANRFDIAIIDLMMPDTNGLQLSRAVREAHPEVTTILMSAYHLSLAQLVRADTGAVGFVPKPFRFDDLVQFVHAKLAQREGIATATPAADGREGDGRLSPFELPRTI